MTQDAKNLSGLLNPKRQKEHHTPQMLNLLKAAGLKRTKGRMEFLRVLLESPRHLSAEEIREALEHGEKTPPGLSTIYRAIHEFESAGLLRCRNFGDGSMRCELQRREDLHGHFIDADSGKVEEFFSEHLSDMLKKLAAESGYEVLQADVLVSVRKKT